MIEASSTRPRLFGFVLARPAFEATQERALAWLASLHTAAERSRRPATFDEPAFFERMRKLLYRYGCSPDKIEARGYEIPDGNHTDWAEMRIYDVLRSPEGSGTLARGELFCRAADAAMARLYPEGEPPPRELLHVTCTGYAAPSAAQRLVAARGWGDRTRVTHAYHMGCYASLPAIRLAGALVATDAEPARADVVHNEVCTLHLQPADHSPEQLVVQSLFADGHVRYSVAGARAASGRSLEVVAQREAILPDSTASMAWIAADHGMRMTLARDLPARIARSARAFVAGLFADAGLDVTREAPGAVFAVHPGGPKVIDVVGEALELTAPQVEASRRVLRRYGNMSSATLPHIWADLVGDDAVACGTAVVSLAFGPGLTVSGALMVKR